MQYIENDFLKINIKTTGAELSSIFNKITNTEMLWQGDATHWNGQAPILFPTVGGLKNGSYIHNGKTYELGRHGFARRSTDWNIEKASATSIKCTLDANSKTLAVYPFKFQLVVTYSISEKTLNIHHEVFNLDSEPLPFSIGGHPAFNCPISDTVSYSDYSLEFSSKENDVRHFLNDEGLLNGETDLVLKDTKKLPLSENLFNEDALIFKNLWSKEISLNGPKGKLLSVRYLNFPTIGIWAAPKAPFVCIEPWIGHADTEDSDQNLFNKEGSVSLNSKETFKAEYQIILA